MKNPIISGFVGIALVGIAAVMLRSHYATWQRRKNNTNLSDLDRRYFYSQYRRRMQTSGLMALLGVLIPLGDSPLIWNRGPQISTIYWLGVLAITLWLMLLAVGDFASTRVHSKAALSAIRRERRELEAKVAEMRSRRSNGKPSDS